MSYLKNCCKQNFIFKCADLIFSETESWHLISTGSKNSDSVSPARHKHSAVLHSDAMWVYGGMTDLQERSDLWRWDIISKTWQCIKNKINPGPLHSHAACKLPSSMLIFGGERNGQNCNELWKFSFGKLVRIHESKVYKDEFFQKNLDETSSKK